MSKDDVRKYIVVDNKRIYLDDKAILVEPRHHDLESFEKEFLVDKKDESDSLLWFTVEDDDLTELYAWRSAFKFPQSIPDQERFEEMFEEDSATVDLLYDDQGEINLVVIRVYNYDYD